MSDLLQDMLTKLIVNPYEKIKKLIYNPIEKFWNVCVKHYKITFCFLLLVYILPPLIRAILK
jgi:hypothetical protein